jgi:hypothetical protein
VVFEGSYCSFGGVLLVDVWWYELESDVFFIEELLENFEVFVV